MSKYKGKTNNDILLEIKQLQADHEALKQKMLRDYDALMVIEETFRLANMEITNRLKGKSTI